MILSAWSVVRCEGDMKFSYLYEAQLWCFAFPRTD